MAWNWLGITDDQANKCKVKRRGGQNLPLHRSRLPLKRDHISAFDRVHKLLAIMMNFTFFLVLAVALRFSHAELRPGVEMQLTCTGIENNPCFDNRRNPKCLAIFQMIEAKFYLVFNEDAAQDPLVRKLQEEEELTGSNLRGSTRQMQNVCANCGIDPTIIFWCEFNGCFDRRDLQEEVVRKVCKEEVKLDTYLADFPTSPIARCLEGVNCQLEYLCWEVTRQETRT